MYSGTGGLLFGASHKPEHAGRLPHRKDLHDEWQAGDRRYLSGASMALFKSNSDTGGHRRDRQGRVRTEDQPSKPTTPRGTARRSLRCAEQQQPGCGPRRTGPPSWLLEEVGQLGAIGRDSGLRLLLGQVGGDRRVAHAGPPN
jgi:hypothetical protein